MNDAGMIQVYTGNGKGKTTAAIGLSIRALGAGKKVMFLQFMKAKVYSEHNILPELSPNLVIKTIGKPFFVVKEGVMSPEEAAKWKDKAVFFPPGQPPSEYLEIIAGGMAEAREAVTSGKYDLVVLDELNCALHFGLVSWEDVKSLLENRAENVEIVLTGRGATPELIEIADLVTEMKEIKHYYTKGLEARKGIEN